MRAALPQGEQEAGSADKSSRPPRDLRRIDIHPDHWYSLAWSREVKCGKVFALEDRCAHRQVPLHAGVVDGESIRCCYHGWTYITAGLTTVRAAASTFRISAASVCPMACAPILAAKKRG